MSTLVLDVETLPLASALAEPYPDAERLPPANYKNPEAIAGWREKDKATWTEQRVKECSLTPRLGRIACLGWALGNEEPNTFMAGQESSEKALLEIAWDRISDSTRLVTFNGSFDLRFLVVRSMVHGVACKPVSVGKVADWFKRYSTWPHFDCRAVLTGWDDRQTGKLHEWCASFGIPSDDTTSGADVYAFAQAGNWDAIAQHCKSDVNQTRELYCKLAPLFGGMAA